MGITLSQFDQRVSHLLRTTFESIVIG